jgi:hypothetical protein
MIAVRPSAEKLASYQDDCRSAVWTILFVSGYRFSDTAGRFKSDALQAEY